MFRDRIRFRDSVGFMFRGRVRIRDRVRIVLVVKNNLVLGSGL